MSNKKFKSNQILYFLVIIGDYSSGVIWYYDLLKKNLSKASKEFHTRKINYLKYLSNGYVASSSDDFTVNIWDPNTWSSIQVYRGHKWMVNCLDQIDNDTIVSGSDDKEIHIWKISTGEIIRKISTGYFVNSVRVFLDGFQIACGLNSNGYNFDIYNYSSGSRVNELYGHTRRVNAIEILNEQYIASGSDDKRVIIWDLETYSIKYNLPGHPTFINCLKRLSSSLLASGDFNGSIIIWNWLEGTIVHRLIGHNGILSFSSLDFNHYDQTLISGSFDKTIKIWNISNGTLIETINTGIQIRALALIN